MGLVDVVDVLLWLEMVALVWLAPFTKVEESFTLQAVHDILFHRLDVAAYDHHIFPGVVARTFWGALAVALCSAPAVLVARALLHASKHFVQLLVRVVLGTLVLAGVKRLRSAIAHAFDTHTATAWALLLGTQFHFCFYVSRPLPNVLALALVCAALAEHVRGRAYRALALLAVVVAVLRFDVALLAAGVAWASWWQGRASVRGILTVGVLSAGAALLVSVPLDSLLWRRLVWPEGTGLLFNVVENRSHMYGVMPWHWYFSSALPRALLLALPLCAVGVWMSRRARPLVALAVFFVGLYSYLPHKEVRFIMYAFPLFNVAAAEAVAAAWKARGWRWRPLALLLVAGALVGSLAASAVMLEASRRNYPGGEALQLLHKLRADDVQLAGASVWLDNLACQTGVSRFGQVSSTWLYSKTDERELGGHWGNFTFIISERSSLGPGFRQIGSVEQFERFVLGLPPRVLMRTALRVFENELN